MKGLERETKQVSPNWSDRYFDGATFCQNGVILVISMYMA